MEFLHIGEACQQVRENFSFVMFQKLSNLTKELVYVIMRMSNEEKGKLDLQEFK